MDKLQSLPKILPGYYKNSCGNYKGKVIYNGPSGMNPIANGYTSGSMDRPFDYSEKYIQSKCAISPPYQKYIYKNTYINLKTKN